MNIKIITVGKIKEKYLRMAIDEYSNCLLYTSNRVSLLPASFGGGFCDVLHPVFVNGQAPRCTGIR